MDSFADQLWNARNIVSNLEEQLAEKILKLIGISDLNIHSGQHWPFDDVTHDYYDRSIELKNVNLDFLWNKNWDKDLLELGFCKLYLCYIDGHEEIRNIKNATVTVQK